MRSNLKKLSKKINSVNVSFCSNKQFCGEVVTAKISFMPHDSCPTIQIERNLLTWIKFESVIKESSWNSGIEGSNSTEEGYFIFYGHWQRAWIGKPLDQAWSHVPNYASNEGCMIHARQNLPVLIKCESSVKSSIYNPGIEGSNPTDWHYSIFWSDSVSVQNPPLPSLV